MVEITGSYGDMMYDYDNDYALTRNRKLARASIFWRLFNGFVWYIPLLEMYTSVLLLTNSTHHEEDICVPIACIFQYCEVEGGSKRYQNQSQRILVNSKDAFVPRAIARSGRCVDSDVKHPVRLMMLQCDRNPSFTGIINHLHSIDITYSV